MNQTEQTDVITQLRKQAENDRNTLYQRGLNPQDTMHTYNSELTGQPHRLVHFLLFMFSLCVLFFAVDYLDSEHDYISTISHAVTTNQTVREAYDKIENSDFINQITEWVRPLINKQE